MIVNKLTFLDNGSPAFKLGDRIYKNDIARRLYAYESTGLSPEEIKHLKPQTEESFINHLNMLCDVKDKYIAVLQLLCEDVENTAIKYRAFKEYFDKLYGQGLTVGNWHLNGALEPFDNFYDKAVGEMKEG